MIPNTEREKPVFFSLKIQWRARSSFDMIVFNRCPRGLFVRALVSQTRCKTFEMTPCDTPIILDIALFESLWSKKLTIFSIVTGPLLVGTINHLVWDPNFQTATAHGWMSSTNNWHIFAFGAIGEISTPEKRLTRTEQKWSSIIRLCQRLSRPFLEGTCCFASGGLNVCKRKLTLRWIVWLLLSYKWPSRRAKLC